MPDLITAQYAADALAIGGPLSAAQSAFLARGITAASQAVEVYCCRQFTKAIYTDVLAPALDGSVLVRNPPINHLIRVSSSKGTLLRVANVSPSVTRARARLTYTGDHDSGRTVTGLELVSTAAGVDTTTTLLFSSHATLGALAAAVAGVSGWTAEVPGNRGTWGSLELIGAESALPAGGGKVAEFQGWLEELTPHADPGPGLIWLGSGAWREWDLDSDDVGEVRVVYDGGFATIPPTVQDATVEVLKGLLQGLGVNPFISTEAAGEYSYSYDFRDKGVRVTEAAARLLAPYRLVVI